MLVERTTTSCVSASTSIRMPAAASKADPLVGAIRAALLIASRMVAFSKVTLVTGFFLHYFLVVSKVGDRVREQNSPCELGLFKSFVPKLNHLLANTLDSLRRVVDAVYLHACHVSPP